MTVRELIEALEKSSPDVQVLISCEVERINNHPIVSVSMPVGRTALRLVADSNEDIWPAGFLKEDA